MILIVGILTCILIILSTYHVQRIREFNNYIAKSIKLLNELNNDLIDIKGGNEYEK